jgi:hypothetical protein
MAAQRTSRPGVRSSVPGSHLQEHAQSPVVFSLDAPTPHVTANPTARPDGSDRQARTRIRTQWTSRLATPADAELLQVPIGTVVLHILRTITDADGNVIKATKTLCPGSHTVLHHSYPISPSR